MYMKHKKIVIAGGTGFIAQAMAQYFGKDNHVILLSRKAVNNHNNNYDHELIKAADGYNITTGGGMHSMLKNTGSRMLTGPILL